MKRIIFTICLCILIFQVVLVSAGFSQEFPANASLENKTLRIYLDNDNVDQSYMKREITFVDFTRDPNLAQVHIIVSSQHTGSGGHKNTLDFIGREVFKGQDHQLFFLSEPTETEEVTQRGLARVMKMGLMPYVSQTDIAEHVDISFNEEEGEGFQDRTVDPWNYWVFRFDVGGDFGWEKSQKDMQLSGSANARRVTDDWRIEGSLYYRHDEENYKDDEEEITSLVRSGNLSLFGVRTLTRHWSAGLFFEGEHTTYRNVDLQSTVYPAIEYNFFPWEESHRKIFTVGYYFGYQYVDYHETTLYDKSYEHLLGEKASLTLELKEPWGELDVEIDFSNYFHNLKFYRI